MSWMQTLYETYEANIGALGSSDFQDILSPIAHKKAKAQIEITINVAGEFVTATTVEKDDAETLIPVTEASASRCCGIAPHPLCDTLSYVAGDFCNYLKDEKDIKKAKEKNLMYMKNLLAWKTSAYSNSKISAIYEYLSKDTLAKDLVLIGILSVDENNKFLSEKLCGNAYEACLVRYRVLGQPPEEVHKDPALFKLFSNYYFSSKKSAEDICYITGNKSSITSKHPKGIIQSSYGAKLISANDSSNFTYRGRVSSPQEACAVSYEVSQKAHSALAYLVKKQGVYYGGRKGLRTFVCWNPNGKKVAGPSIFDDLIDDETLEAKDLTESNFRKKLYDTIMGYKNAIEDNDDIVIMGLEAATTGRLSITYYNQLSASDYYSRIEKWYKTCCWEFSNLFADKYIYVQRPPSIKEIIRCALGTQREKFLEVDDKIFKEQAQRLIHCIVDDQPIGTDFIHYLFNRVSTPLANTKRARSIILSTACAVIAKHYNNKSERSDFTVQLNKTNQDRSYLFGRLLAIADYVEQCTYDYKTDNGRETSAIKLQSSFVHYPLKVWATIETALNPYFQKMGNGFKIKYKGLIAEIFSLIKEEDEGKLNMPLDEKYILGFYSQRRELYTKKNEENTEKE